MHLAICSVTLREAAGEDSRFPMPIVDLLCKAVSSISADELRELFERHESDAANFDGRIEEIIRSMQPSLTVHANHRIVEDAKFNNDLVLETYDALVCLEIEKGHTARFEFDVLKMQAFASQQLAKRPGAKVYGAFIVPADNVVARHISGNARESSFAYLRRLGRLIARIDSSLVEDILVVGYGVSLPDEEPRRKEQPTRKKASLSSGKKNVDNVVIADVGLLADEVLWDALKGYPQETIEELRRELAAACLSLREKVNRNSRYLGYSNGGSDAVYVYVQKKNLVVDMRVSEDLAEDLNQLGFVVKARDNFQAKAGWLTGLIVPYDTDKLAEVVKLAVEALSGV